MIGIHQTGTRRDDPMAIRIRIVCEGDLILVFQFNEACHGVGAGTIHSDLSVVVDRHERKSWIDYGIDDLDVQSVNRVDRLPVWARRASQRIDSDLQPSLT